MWNYKSNSLGMLNESEIHLYEYGTTSFINNFCYSMNAWRDETCMGARKNTEKEKSSIAKRVNKNLSFNVNSYNTDRPVNPTVANNKWLGRNNSAEEKTKNDIFH